MDKLKDLASKASGGSSNTGGPAAAGNQGQEDYLDKGLAAAESKYGGGKIDPAKQRGMNEKATDFAREKFEGATG
ncbi:MAG: hypothetical protein LQ340_002822 [Diploschistes diacapsis]|nr:MAG: hypothetical protein LQ340_002822 [Diploschistes diacapsis]